MENSSVAVEKNISSEEMKSIETNGKEESPISSPTKKDIIKPSPSKEANSKSSPTKMDGINSSPSKDSSPKSSPTKKDIDIAQSALNHFAQGKRHLLVNDISSAVNSLQEACRLLGEHYGETAPECGDAYFYYGKALLELARIENGVLGNALDGEEESTKDSEEEDSKDGEDKKESEDEEMETQEESSQDEDDKEENEGEDSEEKGDDTAEEEEVGNLQLSWEMLELAKLIFSRQVEANPEAGLKLAQVYLKLGEVGLENENYTDSIGDFQECLKIQKRDLKSDDRCLAETNYQIGVAHSFSDNFDKAVESFQAAADVIKNRISSLKDMKVEKASWTDEQKKKYAQECEDPFYSEQNEIEELESLLPEILEKISDMEEMKKESGEKFQKMKENAFACMLRGKDGASTSKEISSAFGSPSSGVSSAFGSPSSGTSSAFGVSETSGSSKPTSNITHLIRKKRKPEEEPEKEETTKKAKVENGDEKHELKKIVSSTEEEMEITQEGKTETVAS